MSKGPSSRSAVPTGADGDEDIPPISACAVCRSASCAGNCETLTPAPLPGDASLLPWEDSAGRTLRALIETAEATAIRPEVAFGRPDAGSLPRALSFALLAEGLAVASIVAPLCLGYLSLLPADARTRSVVLSAITTSTLAWGAATAVVLLLHAAWGAAMEHGIQRAGATPNQRRGFSFSCYSTGWDLLTSPLGATLGLVWLGPRRYQTALGAALRVPRTAAHHYLDEARALVPREKKSAERAALTGLAVGFALLIIGVAWATFAYLSETMV